MKKIFINSIFIILANVAYSQEDEIIPISEIKQSTIVTQPATLHQGFFKLGTWVAFGVADKIFTEDGKKEYVAENSWAKSSTYSLELQYGITNRLAVAISLPYERSSYYFSMITQIPSEDYTSESKFKLNGKGIGDLDFGIYFQLIEGSRTKPSLVARLNATFPTGEKDPTNIKDSWDYDLPTGYGETTLDFGLIYRKIAFPYAYSFTGSAKFSLGGEKIMRVGESPISFRSGVYINVGGSFSFMLNDWIAIQNELFVAHRQPETYDGETAASDKGSTGFHYMPYLHFQLKKFRFIEGVSIPVIGKNQSADPQFIILVQYIF